MMLKLFVWQKNDTIFDTFFLWTLMQGNTVKNIYECC